MQSYDYSVMLLKANQLVGVIKGNDNILKKANSEGRLTDTFKNENDAQMRSVGAKLGGDIYSLFEALKSDFYAQKITLAVYQDYLKKLWNIFQDPTVMIDVPELCAQELYNEISKFTKI